MIVDPLIVAARRKEAARIRRAVLELYRATPATTGHGRNKRSAYREVLAVIRRGDHGRMVKS